MRLAFVLYKYFQYGGLSRDLLQIAQACLDAGHQVHVYTMAWDGSAPEGIEVNPIKVRRFSRHMRNRAFSRELHKRLKNQPVDPVVGFNKTSDLDVYYAADGGLREKLQAERSWFPRLAPRYRHFIRYEQAALNVRLADMLVSPRRREWSERGIAYGRSQDLFGRADTAARLIQEIGEAR